jgi:tetratricopeptide (TPR) repeat protein
LSDTVNSNPTLTWTAVQDMVGEHHTEAYFALGVTCAVSGASNQAEEWFHKVLAARPDHWQALHSLAMLHAEQGELEPAVAAWQRAADCMPGSLRIWREMGRALHRLGEHERAIAAFRQGLAAVPDDPESFLLRHELGRALLAGGRIEEALDAFAAAVAQQPGNPMLRTSLATACLAAERRADAETELRQPLSLKPDLVPALFTLGTLLLDGACHQESVELLSRAAELAPESPRILRKLAVALHKLSRSDEAESMMRKALELEGRGADR